jgi:ornithine cyclodeaminase
MRFIDAEAVKAGLPYAVTIPLMREAMAAFSGGRTRQLLRSILPLEAGNLFGVMPGALAADGAFGAKLISVFPHNFDHGVPSHQGVIVLFDGASGAPVCVIDAGEVTALRTAAASAMATDVLARPDASHLTLLGYGRQAEEHARAITAVRAIESLAVWGRDLGRAQAFADRMGAELKIPCQAAARAADAVAGADIICTLTPATEPILEGPWVAPGSHVNLVGAGHAGQLEADIALVAGSRFFVDSREGVIAQGGEFIRAREAGAVDESHIAGEIGEVVLGVREGRRSLGEITVYKSLGHIAQDLACAFSLYTGHRHA